MTIYMCAPAIRVLTALLCVTTVCGNVALMILYLIVHEHIRSVPALLSAVAYCGVFWLIGTVQFSLWEGFVPPVNTGMAALGLIVAAALNAGLKFAKPDGGRFRMVSLSLLLVSIVTLPVFRLGCLSFLAAAIAANVDASLALMQFGHMKHRRPMPYVLAQIVYALPVGIALYGGNGRLVDRNEAYDGFLSSLNAEGGNACDLIRQEAKFRLGGKTYETTVERIANGRHIVMVRDTTSHEEAIAAERSRIDAIERKRLMTLALAEQDRQIAMLRQRERVIARLHDTVGQTLAIVNLSLELCAGQDSVVKTETAKESYLAAAKSALKQYLNGEDAGQPSLMESIVLLRDVYASLGVEIDQAGTPPRLSLREEIAMTAICNEAVANAVRHSAAKRVQLHWRPEQDVLLCVANDAGEERPVSENLGIRGMRERADEIGCVLSVELREGRFWLRVLREKTPPSQEHKESGMQKHSNEGERKWKT